MVPLGNRKSDLKVFHSLPEHILVEQRKVVCERDTSLNTQQIRHWSTTSLTVVKIRWSLSSLWIIGTLFEQTEEEDEAISRVDFIGWPQTGLCCEHGRVVWSDDELSWLDGRGCEQGGVGRGNDSRGWLDGCDLGCEHGGVWRSNGDLGWLDDGGCKHDRVGRSNDDLGWLDSCDLGCEHCRVGKSNDDLGWLANGRVLVSNCVFLVFSKFNFEFGGNGSGSVSSNALGWIFGSEIFIGVLTVFI